jgi:hypothetical protein
MSFVIFFGRDRFETSSTQLTGTELRRLFSVPSDELLYRAQGSNQVGDPIGDAETVPIKNGEHFLAVPRDISGGAPASKIALAPRVEREVNLITEEFSDCGSVEVRADNGGNVLIVPVPAGQWSPDPLRILVRLPALYPDEKPDLLFLEENARPPAGRGIPRLMQSGVVIGGERWHQISWHFTAGYDATRNNLLGFVRSVRSYLDKDNP